MSKLSSSDLKEIFVEGRNRDYNPETYVIACRMQGQNDGTLSCIMGNLDVAHIVMANLDLGMCALTKPEVIDCGQTISFQDKLTIGNEPYEVEVAWMLEQPDAVVWERY